MPRIFARIVHLISRGCDGARSRANAVTRAEGDQVDAHNDPVGAGVDEHGDICCGFLRSYPGTVSAAPVFTLPPPPSLCATRGRANQATVLRPLCGPRSVETSGIISTHCHRLIESGADRPNRPRGSAVVHFGAARAAP